MTHFIIQTQILKKIETKIISLKYRVAACIIQELYTANGTKKNSDG